jgi:hypothetical protein
MSKETNRKGPTASNGANLRKGGRRPGRRQVLTEQQLAFCSAYVRIGSASGAAIYAGYHPASGYRLLENPSIKDQIQRLHENAERREEQLAEGTFAIQREFLDVHLAHQIANGGTHKTRGDADRVKAIEIGYKTLGVIQSNRVVAQASATVVSPQGQTVFEIYKSRWLIEKEAAMAARLEGQNGKGSQQPFPPNVTQRGRPNCC